MGYVVNKKQDKAFDGFDIPSPSVDFSEICIRVEDERAFMRKAQFMIENSTRGSLPNIALSGGSAGKVYSYIAENSDASHFSEVSFWQVDERYVSRTSEHSNQRLVRQNMLDKLGEDNYKNFFVFNTDLDSSAEIINDYEKKLKDNLKRNFDLVVLGIGNDGHTASLFAGGPELESKALAVASRNENYEIADRFSLGFRPILEAKKILVLLAGKSKKDIVDTLKSFHGGDTSMDYSKYPALKLLEHSNITILFGDY